MSGPSDEGGVVGKLWDAFILSEFRSLASRVGYEGHQFISILGQDCKRPLGDWAPGACLLLALA